MPAGIASWKVICSHGQHELGSQQTGIFPAPLEVLESRESLSSPEAALHQADWPSPIVGLWVCVCVRARDRASRAYVRVVLVETVMVFCKCEYAFGVSECACLWCACGVCVDVCVCARACVCKCVCQTHVQGS